MLLGACNPQFVYNAIAADPPVALRLPCNVIMGESATDTRISVPTSAALLPGRPDISEPVSALLL
ncbi:MAG: DUF302 domain-containing protein [Ferrimicrobium sp.]